jgi:hypothetical protein
LKLSDFLFYLIWNNDAFEDKLLLLFLFESGIQGEFEDMAKNIVEEKHSWKKENDGDEI